MDVVEGDGDCRIASLALVTHDSAFNHLNMAFNFAESAFAEASSGFSPSHRKDKCDLSDWWRRLFQSRPFNA
jgi:hypothetical protein